MTSGPSSEGNERGLPRARRITQPGEIRGLFQRGKRSRTAHLDVFDSASPVSYSRAGFVVPRHKHSAVERNLLKRRLREVTRTLVLPALDRVGMRRDVLLRARTEAYQATYAQLAVELREWLEQACSSAQPSQ